MACDECCVSLEFWYCTARQDALPTGLVLHGFPFIPTVVPLYKVELRGEGFPLSFFALYSDDASVFING